MVRLYLSGSVLTVNMKHLFSQHSSGKGNLCDSFSCVQDRDTELREGMGEVPGVTPDHTSFNHVRVCNHSVHIFGCIGDQFLLQKLYGTRGKEGIGRER